MKKILIYILIILMIFLVSCKKESPSMSNTPADYVSKNYSISNTFDFIAEEDIITQIQSIEDKENTTIDTNNNKTILDILGINDMIYQYKFILKDIPARERLIELNWETDDVPYLTKKDGKLIISYYYEKEITTFEIAEGYFIGFYCGEFIGSGLYFISRNGDFYDIGNLAVGFYSFDDLGNPKSIYYLYGNGQISSGYIGKLVKENNIWIKDENFVIDLGRYSVGGFPNAFFIEQEEEVVYVVTDTQLIKIKNDKIEQILVEDAFWVMLSPNSIVNIDNNLYIGMRGGIASYNLETSELLWYEKVSY